MVGGNRLREFIQTGVRLADGRKYRIDQPLTMQLGNKGVRSMVETMFGRMSNPTEEAQCSFQCALQGLEHRVGWAERERGTGTVEILMLKHEAQKLLVKGPIIGRLPVREYCELHDLPTD